MRFVNSRFVALIVVFASMYVALGYVLHPISFLQIQVRIADALYPLIAVFGLPSLVGLVIGHFLLNLSSPLGLIDLLSIPLFIPAKVAIWKWGLKAVPLHVISVGLWVPTMLCFFAPPEILVPSFLFWVFVSTVTIGEFIAEYILGVRILVPSLTAIQRRLMTK